MFDRYCSGCGHQFRGPLASTPCPECGDMTFILPFKMQVNVPTEQTKQKKANEHEAGEYLDNEAKQHSEEQREIAKTDEEWQRKYHAADFPNRLAEDLGKDYVG